MEDRIAFKAGVTRHVSETGAVVTVTAARDVRASEVAAAVARLAESAERMTKGAAKAS